MNWLRNAHYLISNKVKHDYHLMVFDEMRGTKKFNKIRLSYRVYVRRSNIDGHNIRAVIEKFFLDGLVEGGYINNDSVNFVIGDDSSYFIDSENPRIEIDIKEVE